MKVSPFFILLSIVGSAEAQARTRHRRHLNTIIKGDESSMSYASIEEAKGSSSSSKKSDPTLMPTQPQWPTYPPAPPPPAPPVVSCVIVSLYNMFTVLWASSPLPT